MRVHEPGGSPPPGFERVTATLEDAYLVLMRPGSAPSTAPAHTNGHSVASEPVAGVPA